MNSSSLTIIIVETNAQHKISFLCPTFSFLASDSFHLSELAKLSRVKQYPVFGIMHISHKMRKPLQFSLRVKMSKSFQAHGKRHCVASWGLRSFF